MQGLAGPLSVYDRILRTGSFLFYWCSRISRQKPEVADFIFIARKCSLYFRFSYHVTKTVFSMCITVGIDMRAFNIIWFVIDAYSQRTIFALHFKLTHP